MGWFGKLASQTPLLLGKNGKILWRNKGSTLLQTCIGLVFIALLYGIQAGLDGNKRAQQAFSDTRHMPAQQVPPIVRCTLGRHVEQCYTFLYTPNTPTARKVVRLVREQNAAVDFPALPDPTLAHIPDEGEPFGVLGFPSEAELNEWLFAHPNTTLAAVTFQAPEQWAASRLLNYTLQFNATNTCTNFGMSCTNPYVDVAAPLQLALDRALLTLASEMAGHGAAPALNVSMRAFPHPDLPLRQDAMKSYGTLFVFAALMFNFIISLSQLLMEKEDHLRDAMRSMGLSNAAYWLSWLLTNLSTNLVSVLILCATGMAFNLGFFTKNAFGAYFLLFLLFACALTAMGYMFSALLRTSNAGRNLGFCFFILFYILGGGLVQVYFYDTKHGTVQFFLSLLAPLPFLKGMKDLVDASSGGSSLGLAWADRGVNTPVYPLASCFSWLVVDFFLYALLAWYLDCTAPGQYGRPRPLHFPFTLEYWTGRSRRPPPISRDTITLMPGDDPDVRAEAQAVSRDVFEGRDVAVKVQGLVKRFVSFALPSLRTKTSTAVNGVAYAVDEGQLFCLLGHNGAGKTTTLNMLTGATAASAGDAKIFGLSVASEMDEIRRIMGVCPQHDVLWPQLTGREHLQLFAGLRGMSREAIPGEVRERLAQVALTEAADVPAGSYSGGMQRRLSIAIALIGDPRVVFLDEPTTGMDPVTRRQVWDMIEDAKRGRVIILTTHSMEEADILGDRIGIMAHGRMQAVGTSLRLKNKFGAGYHLTLFTDPDREESVRQFVMARLPGTILESALKGCLVFRVPRMAYGSESVMGDFFRALELNKEALCIRDVSVGLTTLEEVFLHLAHLQEEAQRAMEQAGDNASRPFPPVAPEEAGLPPLPSLLSGEGAAEVGTFAALMQSASASSLISRTPRSPPGAAGITAAAAAAGVGPAALARQASAARVAAAANAGADAAEAAAAGAALEAEEEGSDDLGRDSDDEEREMLLSDEEGGFARSAAQQLVANDLEMGTPGQRGARGFVPKFSFWSQVRALSYKTATYQARQQCQMCCTVLFPVLAIVLLVVVQHLISGLDRVQYDMQCVHNLTRQSFVHQRPSHPGYTVGFPFWYILDPDYRTPERPGFTVPYAFTGPAEERAFVGELNNTLSPRLWGWYRGVLASVTDVQSCVDEYEATLRHNVQLKNAAQWQQQNQTGGTAGEAALAVCQTSADQPSWSPSAALLQRLDREQNKRDGCVQGATERVFQGFAAMPSTQGVVEKRSGLLGYVSTQRVDDVIFQPFFDGMLALLKTMRRPVFGGVYSVEALCANASLVAEAAALVQGVPNVCWLVQNRDAVRQLTFVPHPSDAAVDADTYEAWGGEAIPEADIFLVRVAGYVLEQAHTATAQFRYTALYNETGAQQVNWPAILHAMHRAALRAHTGDALDLDTLVRPFPTYIDEDSLRPLGGLSVIDMLGGIIFPFVLFTLMPVIMSLLMYEKENRLREITKMMGLKMSVYWLVHYVFFLAEYLVVVAVLWIVGAFIGLNFFTLHSPVIMATFLLVWGNSLIAFSMLLTVGFSRTRTATAVGFILIFAFVIGGYQIFGQLEGDPHTTEAAYWAYQWLPPFAFMRAMLFFTQASTLNDAITLQNMHTTPIPRVLTALAVEWVVVVFLLWYLEQVLSVGYGVRKHPLFCFGFSRAGDEPAKKPARTGSSLSLAQYAGTVELASPQAAEDEPADVAGERDRVLYAEGSGAPFVRMLRLHKRFPSPQGADKIAVRDLCLGINRNECFGLLGPNGAGKTTTISMLCGLFAPSSGTVRVAGELDLLRDLDNIHMMMGVCPQFDVLWHDLTGREHLLFYGRLKNLNGPALLRAVRKALRSVQLEFAADRPAGAYSGGMRRRLSVAIALMGNPRIVVLDEPSTGLDPASRRNLWDVISAAKGDRSVLLTTHSMEEADALCDRLAVMTHGALQCIGVSPELKRRFGAGFTLTVTSRGGTERERRVAEVVVQMFPSARLMSPPIGGTQSFEIRREEVNLADVFEEMERRREELHVTDWGITETTLEQVFHKITDAAAQQQRAGSRVRSLSETARTMAVPNAGHEGVLRLGGVPPSPAVSRSSRANSTHSQQSADGVLRL